jgi:RsiW-degrading membrane proteinase PrsW (M82 family)
MTVKNIIITAIVVMFFTYAMFGFILWDLNLKNMEVEMRGIMVLIWLAFTCIILSAVHWEKTAVKPLNSKQEDIGDFFNRILKK